jgi:hypothetical protein
VPTTVVDNDETPLMIGGPIGVDAMVRPSKTPTITPLVL